MVTQLFDPRFVGVLNRYPLAQAAAAGIRQAVADGTVPIEDHLRQHLRDSDYPYRRQQYWEIPLYLQDLLDSCGNGYATETDNYNRLVDVVLAHPSVAFVSFNYDLLLDRALNRYEALGSIDAYFGVPNRNWVLFKPHGSVAWSREIRGGAGAVRLSSDTSQLCLQLALEDIAPDRNVVQRTPLVGVGPFADYRITENAFWYPSLSVPVGAGGTFSCPEAHVAGFRQWVRTHRTLRVVVAGYSCLDAACLSLIKDEQAHIVDILIANGGTDDGELALRRLQEELGPSGPREDRDQIEIYPGGFGAVTRSDSLRGLIQRRLP